MAGSNEFSEEEVSHQCVDCGRFSPKTSTGYTLLSSEHGWRLSRETLPSGELSLRWRCPDCWKKHKERQGGGVISPRGDTEPPSSQRRPISSAKPSIVSAVREALDPTKR